MNIIDLLKSEDNIEISPNVSKYEKKYETKLNLKASKIFSLVAGFYDTDNRVYRILDSDEILDPEKYLGINMIQLKLIPLIDISDNDFICYDIIKNKFRVFNIIDESSCMENDTLIKVVNELEK